MREIFIPKRFRGPALDIIEAANKILAEYEAEGLSLTVRQLYYQFVARDLFPDTRRWGYDRYHAKWVKDPGGTKNAQPNYSWLDNLITEARNAGLIDWDMITDRVRGTLSNSHWSGPGEILDAAGRSFAIDKWEDQPNHVEVMVEKQALEGILIPVCRELDISFTANRGFCSTSLMYEAGKRLAEYVEAGKWVWVLYLGDHDPSGINMTGDIKNRLHLYSTGCSEYIIIDRLALNMDQVEQMHPPENYAKETDSRYQEYIDRYGPSCWELDAIEPRTLRSLVTDRVEQLRDNALWTEALAREAAMRADLNKFVATYKGD